MSVTQIDNNFKVAALEVDVALIGGGIGSGMMGLDMRFFAKLEH